MRFLGAAIGVLTALVAGWLLMPLVVGASRPQAPARPASPRAARLPLDVPAPPGQREREELDLKRVPFYRILRERHSDTVLRFGVTGDADTLDLVISGDDQRIIDSVLQDAVAPNAAQYGFREVRFFVRSPAGSIDPLTAVAESTRGDDGRWTTWRK